MKKVLVWASVVAAVLAGYVLFFQFSCELTQGGWRIDDEGPSSAWQLLVDVWYCRRLSPFYDRAALIVMTLMGMAAVMFWLERSLRILGIIDKTPTVRKEVLDGLRFGGPGDALGACDQLRLKKCHESSIARAVLAEVSTAHDRGSQAMRMELAGRRAYRAEAARLRQGLWVLRALVPAAPLVSLLAAGLDFSLAVIIPAGGPEASDYAAYCVGRGGAIAVYGLAVSLGCLVAYLLLSRQIEGIERGLSDFADELIGVCLVQGTNRKPKLSAGAIRGRAPSRREKSHVLANQA
jgi:biopolymer transport protein ExbB/TolQ